MEEIRAFVENLGSSQIEHVDWPDISTYPINEYNTEGLFDMAFPTKFPSGDADWLQPRISHVPLHEYALHLLRYFDQCFGKHPRFRYFLLNIIMCHCSQASVAIFVQKSMHEKDPTTIKYLRSLLCNLPEQKLA